MDERLLDAIHRNPKIRELADKLADEIYKELDQSLPSPDPKGWYYMDLNRSEDVGLKAIDEPMYFLHYLREGIFADWVQYGEGQLQRLNDLKDRIDFQEKEIERFRNLYFGTLDEVTDLQHEIVNKTLMIKQLERQVK